MTNTYFKYIEYDDKCKVSDFTSSTKILINKLKDKCDGSWKFDKLISFNKQTNVSIYSICNTRSCDYIIKIVLLEKIDNVDNVMTEINLQTEAFNKSLSIEIIQIVIDETKIGFLMEKMTITVESKILSLAEYNKKDDIIKVIIEVCDIIEKLHNETNIIFNDVHFNNFMYNKDDIIKIIDFGESSHMNDENTECRYDDFVDVFNSFYYLSDSKYNKMFESMNHIVYDICLKYIPSDKHCNIKRHYFKDRGYEYIC